MNMLDSRVVRASRLVSLVVLLVCSAADVAAQIQPTIRSNVVLVPLDIRVLDRDRNPVRDLMAADFNVYEDGRAVVYDYDRDGIRSARSPIRDRK